MLVEMLGLIGVRSMHARAGGRRIRCGRDMSNTEWLGQALFTRFLLPFEIAALILTVGVVAAVVLTLRARAPTQRHESGQPAGAVSSRAIACAWSRWMP